MAMRSCFENAHVTDGSAHNGDMTTGLCVTLRAMCCKFKKKPQSPVTVQGGAGVRQASVR